MENPARGLDATEQRDERPQGTEERAQKPRCCNIWQACSHLSVEGAAPSHFTEEEMS